MFRSKKKKKKKEYASRVFQRTQHKIDEHWIKKKKQTHEPREEEEKTSKKGRRIECAEI